MTGISKRTAIFSMLFIIFGSLFVLPVRLQAAGSHKKGYRIMFHKDGIHLTIGRKTDCPVTVFKGKKTLKHPKLVFKSSNSHVASVNSRTGKVKAKAAGKCKIICSCYVKGGPLKNSIHVVVKRKLKNFKNHFTYIGHRGDPDHYPENSIAGFERSIQNGCAGIECDLWETAGGDLLICHDWNLKKLCGADISIRSLTEESRYEYPLKSKTAGRYYIPTLHETLESMKSKNGIVYLHLKQPSKLGKESLDKIYNEIRDTGMLEQTVVFCKAKGALKYLAKKEDPPLLARWLSPKKSFNKNLSWCRKNGISQVFLSKIKYLNRYNVNRCRAYGLDVGIYWLGNKEAILLGMDYGIDFGLLIHDSLNR